MRFGFAALLRRPRRPSMHRDARRRRAVGAATTVHDSPKASLCATLLGGKHVGKGRYSSNSGAGGDGSPTQ